MSETKKLVYICLSGVHVTELYYVFLNVIGHNTHEQNHCTDFTEMKTCTWANFNVDFWILKTMLNVFLIPNYRHIIIVKMNLNNMTQGKTVAELYL